MKQKQLAKLTAFVVGVMAGSAFGDHHDGWWYVNCSTYQWDCQTACEDYNQCLSSAIDPSLCDAELAWLEACPSTIVGPPPLPPPSSSSCRLLPAQRASTSVRGSARRTTCAATTR